MKATTTVNGEKLAEAADSLRTYRDAVREMSHEERQRYQGQVLAILCKDGRVIASAPTADELLKAVAAAGIEGRAWRMIDGPGAEPPLSVDEFLLLHHEQPRGDA